MIDYALNYLKMGFNVIPISKNGKTPLVAFADKPQLTESDLRRFWRDYPMQTLHFVQIHSLLSMWICTGILTG